MRRSGVGSRGALWVLLGALVACADRPDTDSGQAAPVVGEAPAGPAWFEDVSAGSGVTFLHRNGAGGDKHLLEMNGGSVALLDQDGDGDLELLFAQSVPLPGCDGTGKDWRDRMYRCVGPWKYEDVTDEMNVDDEAFSLSATVPDFDGDGDPDILYCDFGQNRFFRNDGIRFVDVTADSGIAAEDWSSVACWADFDRDGDLDCYVTNYLTYDLADVKRCGKIERGEEWHSYCDPLEFDGKADCLYENLGGGRFRDVSVAAGLEHSDGKGLGLTTLDVDDDGLLDVFVANDTMPNFLWRNEGGLRFVDVAPERGVDLGGTGLSEACMGVDLADVDRDGDFDMVVTNFALETNTLYRDEGDWYTDRSFPSGLGEPSLPLVSFGARFVDLDNDGDEDLATASGHILDNIELYHATLSFHQPAQLYANRGDGVFDLVPAATAGRYFSQTEIGRGLASFDPDRDGVMDLLYMPNSGSPVFLKNHRGQGMHWIGFDLVGPQGNPTAIGARVEVLGGGQRWLREQRGATSYISVSDPVIHVGLGKVDALEAVNITWPDGTRKTLPAPAVDQYHRVAY